MHLDITLKLLIGAAVLEKLQRHPLLRDYAIAPPPEQTQLPPAEQPLSESLEPSLRWPQGAVPGQPQVPPLVEQRAALYFDTPDLQIHQAHGYLSVSQVGEHWQQSLKTDSRAEHRQEWTTPVTGPQPDLASLRQQVGALQPWHSLLTDLQVQNEDRNAQNNKGQNGRRNEGQNGRDKEAQHEARKNNVQLLFHTQLSRHAWTLSLPGGDEVRATLEQGELTHALTHKGHSLPPGKRKLPLNALTLELLSGHPKCLFELALELLKSVPLQPDWRSQAEYGYALLAAPQAVKAKPLDLLPNMNVEQAFQAVVRNCLEQIQANEADVAHGHTPESLHQLRVGLRRLRSALRLFEKVVPCPSDLHKQLDALASGLGPARDWDVLLDSTLPWLTNSGNAQPIDALRQVAKEHAQRHHLVASARVNAPRYSRLMLSFGAWFEGAGWRESPQTDADQLNAALPSFAQKSLDKAQKRLKKRGKGLTGADPIARHRVRIAAKKMRYSAEFLHALYPKKAMAAYARAVTKLQDELGQLNDAAVAEELLRDVQSELQGPPPGTRTGEQPDAPGEHGHLSESLSFVRGCLNARQQCDVRNLRKPWKKWRALAKPWRT
jgi:triphosphatase